jgi:hypothetical protein
VYVRAHRGFFAGKQDSAMMSWRST